MSGKGKVREGQESIVHERKGLTHKATYGHGVNQGTRSSTPESDLR
jgi:hypothetical protein